MQKDYNIPYHFANKSPFSPFQPNAQKASSSLFIAYLFQKERSKRP